MSLSLGPFHFLSFSGTLEDLAAGRNNPDALKGLEGRLPEPNSLRRAGDDTKAAVAAATELLRGTGTPVSEKVGLYVGQQQISLGYCSQFIETSYRSGPRMASPMMFSESVANNVATHASLTLGLKGMAQTFIGTRAAGIQAVMAAVEDVESGHVETGLVVVLGVATSHTRDAYLSVYRPYQRRNREEVPFLRGVVAMLVRREAAGQARLVYSGIRCCGRRPGPQINAVRTLWTEADARMVDGTRVLTSTLCLAKNRSMGVISQVGETVPLRVPLDEGYALDPFARLLLDSRMHPGVEGRAVLCLGEEGMAAMLALNGPARVLGL
jgi:hypothetical protein